MPELDDTVGGLVGGLGFEEGAGDVGDEVHGL
jgi:hypothetical protein